MSSTDEHLQQFQDSANRDRLEQFIRASGRDIERYQPVLNQLAPMFATLSYGEQPDYESIDKAVLEQHAPEVQDIVGWMVASSKADVREAAIALIGASGSEVFLPHLTYFLNSGHQWERLAAVRSLVKIEGSKVNELLCGALLDSDPQVRAEASAALDGD